MEIAAAAGLRHVPLDARDPRETTSYGVGEFIRCALDLGATRLLIGCGDSGVSDGGIGLAEALGARPLDRHGRKIGRGDAALRRLASIDLSDLDPRLRHARIEVAVNWQNMLLGPQGVARLYGPQKGASPKGVAELEEGLGTLAAVIRQELGIDVASLPGGGASGGLGAGLHAFLGAKLVPRFRVASRFVPFDRLLERANLVLTAEGKIDQLTARGKMPAEIARRAKRRGVSVIALVGTIGDGAETNHAVGIDAYFSIVNGPCSPSEAMEQAPKLVAQATEQVMRLVLSGSRSRRARLTPAMPRLRGEIERRAWRSALSSGDFGWFNSEAEVVLSRSSGKVLSLSQMSSGWRETTNRVILTPNVGRLQIALVAAHRVIPITSVT